MDGMMKETAQVESLAASDEVILYWEKQGRRMPDMETQVLLDGVPAGITDKTHFTLSNLKADTDYQVGIRQLSGQDGLTELHLRTGAGKQLLDVTKAPYGAVKDGRTKNTEALQRAIDDCTKEQAVYLPAGIYMTGALRLHSDMELYLDEGAVLQGTDDPSDYLPKCWSRFEGTELLCYSSLLNLGELDHAGGFRCENVVIRGKGTIASGGSVLAERVICQEREQLQGYLQSLGDKINECEKPETIPGRVRPRLIQMCNCRNVALTGLTLKNGASWNVHMIYSEHIVTANCTFHSEGVWNGDGWDPDSSKDCTIFNCTFYTGDDSIAIKSGKNPEGNVINRPCTGIRIFDCRCACGHGIAIGSEMSGGVEDVAIWDCDLSGSSYGIEIKGTGKRGGYVRGIRVMDSSVSRILFHSVGYNDDGPGAPTAPQFEKCHFENIRVWGGYYNGDREWTACDAIELCGFDTPGHELRDIVFRNVTLQGGAAGRKQSLSLQACCNITFEGIRCL